MEKWLQGLDVWAWRYKDPPRGYRGAHLTARPTSCVPLLHAVDVLQQEGPGGRRTIPLRPLEAEYEQQITGGMPFVAFSSLQIAMENPCEELRRYCISKSGQRLVVTLTPGHTSDFRRALESVAEGIGDGSIHPALARAPGVELGSRDRSSLQLWYWPCFGHLSATLVPPAMSNSQR